MRRSRTVALLALGIATTLLGCRVPPERNPAPSLRDAVTVSVLLEPADPLADAARLAVRRLNESRSPDERPVRLAVATDGLDAPRVLVPVHGDAPPSTRALVLTPRLGASTDSARVDPELPAVLRSDPAVRAQALAVYDAVLVAGLAARSQPDATPQSLAAWLRDQPGWRLSQGDVSYTGGADPALGPHLLAPDPAP